MRTEWIVVMQKIQHLNWSSVIGHHRSWWKFERGYDSDNILFVMPADSDWKVLVGKIKFLTLQN